MKEFIFWCLDRANQITEYRFFSQEEADDYSDILEAQGHDIFTDRQRCVLACDRYARLNKRG